MSDFDALTGWIDALASTEVDEFARTYTYKALTASLVVMGRMAGRIEKLEARLAELEGEQPPATAPDLDRAVVCIQRALQIVEAHNLNVAAENLTEALDMLTAPETVTISKNDYNRALNDLSDGIAAAKMGQHDTAHLCMKSALRLLTS